MGDKMARDNKTELDKKTELDGKTELDDKTEVDEETQVDVVQEDKVQVCRRGFRCLSQNCKFFHPGREWW